MGYQLVRKNHVPRGPRSAWTIAWGASKTTWYNLRFSAPLGREFAQKGIEAVQVFVDYETSSLAFYPCPLTAAEARRINVFKVDGKVASSHVYARELIKELLDRGFGAKRVFVTWNEGIQMYHADLIHGEAPKMNYRGRTKKIKKDEYMQVDLIRPIDGEFKGVSELVRV